MIKWAPFPVVRFSLALIAGILLGLKAGAHEFQLLYLFMPAFGLFVGFFFLAGRRRSATLNSVAGIVGLVCLVLAGWSLTQLRTQKNDPAHLLHHPGTVTHYQGYINDFLQEKPTVFQTTLRLQQIKADGQWQPVTGQVQVTFRKEPGMEKPAYGDVLLIKGEPQEVQAPLNPGQFNYRNFLEAKNIYHQHYLWPGQYQKLGQQIPNPVLAYSIKLRQNLDRILRENLSSRREYGIASALVLGIKDEMDNSVKAAYASTGTMHVLAVSGLHVGMLFYLLTTGLRWSRILDRRKWVKVFLIWGVIWTYALITAMSPSVLRASVMFTFIAGAELAGRRSNVYNNLAAAAFFLLCINPFYLLEVGFLLSFLAVLAIVFLQPKIYNLYTFRSSFLDKVWALISVSLAAQIGTVFLSLAFFHQFPVYFLLSNLVAVPLAGFILGGGFALLALWWVPYLGKMVGFMLEKLVWLMNELMLFMESLPGAVITRIPFSGWQAVMCYGMLFLIFVFMARKKLKYLAAATLVMAVFAGSRFAEAYTAASERKLVLLAVPKQSVWAMLENNTAIILADSAFAHDKKAQNFTLEPVLLQGLVKQVNFISWQQEKLLPEQISFNPGPEMQVLVWRGLKLVALEKPLKQNLQQPAEVDYLVLRKNVWFSAEKLPQNFRFKKIILDSSNDQWYQERAERQLKEAGLPFYNVNREGAFVLMR